MLCYSMPPHVVSLRYAALIIPPQIQDQLLDFRRIEVPHNLRLSPHRLRPLSLGEKPSHAAVERPLGGERPAEHDGVPGEETALG